MRILHWPPTPENNSIAAYEDARLNLAKYGHALRHSMIDELREVGPLIQSNDYRIAEFGSYTVQFALYKPDSQLGSSVVVDPVQFDELSADLLNCAKVNILAMGDPETILSMTQPKGRFKRMVDDFTDPKSPQFTDAFTKLRLSHALDKLLMPTYTLSADLRRNNSKILSEKRKQPSTERVVIPSVYYIFQTIKRNLNTLRLQRSRESTPYNV